MLEYRYKKHEKATGTASLPIELYLTSADAVRKRARFITSPMTARLALQLPLTEASMLLFLRRSPFGGFAD